MPEVSRRSILKGAAVAAVAAGGVGGLLSARVARAAGPANKVTRNGAQLLLNGQPYRMVGFGMWPMAMSSWCHPPNYDGRSVVNLAQYLADIRKTAPHVNSIRVWFFQQFALNSGNWDYSGFDACLAAADAAGFKVIPCLEDNWSYERTGSQLPALDTTWFNGGYKSTVLAKEKVPYRQYVQQVVSRYAGDPRISVWELVAEGNAMTFSFAQDVAGLVKSIDPAGLVSCGEVGPLSSSIYDLPSVDLASYHYYADYGQTGWQNVQQAAANAGKPWYLGEYGVSTTGTTRSTSVSGLLSNVFAAPNSAGVLYWQYSEGGGDQFNVGAGDPVLPVLDRYALASASPPPSPSPSPSLPAPGNPADLNKETVRWDAVSGAHHYSVQLLKGGTVVRNRTTAGTSWTWTPLSAGATYQWQVAAVASSGKVGAYTAPRGFTAGRDV
jgi:hypothetical protein